MGFLDVSRKLQAVTTLDCVVSTNPARPHISTLKALFSVLSRHLWWDYPALSCHLLKYWPAGYRCSPLFIHNMTSSNVIKKTSEWLFNTCFIVKVSPALNRCNLSNQSDLSLTYIISAAAFQVWCAESLKCQRETRILSIVCVRVCVGVCVCGVTKSTNLGLNLSLTCGPLPASECNCLHQLPSNQATLSRWNTDVDRCHHK